MAVVVIDRRRVVLGIFAGEAPGVGRGKSAALSGDRAKWSIFVMRRDSTVSRNDLTHILVAVEIVVRREVVLSPNERTGCDWLGAIPDVIVGALSLSWSGTPRVRPQWWGKWDSEGQTPMVG